MTGRVVRGQGPAPADLMLVGEAPGVEESKRGQPFIGKSGGELNRWLDGDALPHRRDCYVTNIYKSQPPKNRDPRPDEIAEHEPLLWDELQRVRPAVIVCLGRLSLRYFMGDMDVEMAHGLAFRGDRVPERFGIRETGWQQLSIPKPVIFGAYHPAAGLHAPELMARFAYDMRRLGLLMQGGLEAAPTDNIVGHYEDIEGACIRSFGDLTAIDTEGSVEQPWCISASNHPGYGEVYRAGQAWQLRFNGPTVFHHALHDLAVLRSLGVDIADGQYEDTMLMAYVLGVEPQGLKALAFRHAGMDQPDYSELTAEASERIARDWLVGIVESLPRHVGPKPHDMEKACRLVERLLKKQGAKHSVRKRWEDGRAREILVEELGVVGEMPTATLDDVPLADAVRYAARDADATLRIYPRLKADVEAMGLSDVLAVDTAILPIVDRMQQVGMGIDVEVFRQLQEEFEAETVEIDRRIAAMAGRPVNVNSGPQVAEWLFGDLGLPTGRKKTASGRASTGDKILEALRKRADIGEVQRQAIHLVQEGREVRKLIGTYCEPIPRLVGADGRLHPRLLLTRTATGRLAAKNPNVLALPKHSERGMRIRGGFVAGPGRVLADWDLDQVEMRMMAIDSKDRQMLAEFRSGVDKHTATASLIFGKPPDAVNKEERFAAKAVNFGILMGITEFGLLDQFHKNGQSQWTEGDCERLLADWHRAYPEASAYISRKHAEARRWGFVRTWLGRIRYTPGVHSPDRYIAAEALRQAQSLPIQGGAIDISKLWMAAAWLRLKAMRQEGIWIEPLLHVHDALMVECEEWAFGMVDAEVKAALAEIQRWAIPVTCKGAMGVRWSDL